MMRFAVAVFACLVFSQTGTAVRERWPFEERTGRRGLAVVLMNGGSNGVPPVVHRAALLTPPSAAPVDDPTIRSPLTPLRPPSRSSGLQTRASLGDCPEADEEGDGDFLVVDLGADGQPCVRGNAQAK